MSRIIITGGNGFIGKNLVKRLLSRKNDNIIIISNISESKAKSHHNSESLKSMPVAFYSADIRDKDTILGVFQKEKADTCIHLAAKTSVVDSIKNPDETMDINVKGTLNVLEACYNSEVSNFVFASSAAVYGDVKELPISENSILKPLSPYGSSKMLGEQHVLDYTRLKKIQNSISLRIFNVYGGKELRDSDVISRFAARISNRLPPIIHGNGNCTRDFISVEDVVEGILLSITAMKNKYYGNLNSEPIFNIGSGTATSVKVLAQKMISLSGLALEPIYEEERQNSGVILHSYSDMTKARKDIGFVAKKNLETGLREILELAQTSRSNS